MRNFLFPLLFLPICLFSQSKEHNFSVSVNGHYGFIIPHYRDMRYFTTSHIAGAEINFVKLPNDGFDEEGTSCTIPERGLSMVYFNLGNPEILGSVIAASPFMNFKLNHSENFKLFFRVGSGFGVIAKPYNRITNHKENAIGSHVNAFMNIRMNAHFRLSEKMKLETGIGISHLSNGSFAVPNLGLNLCTADIGVHYTFGNTVCTNNDSTNKYLQKKYFLVYATTGLKEISPPGGKKYPCFNLSVNREKRFSRTGKYLYGIEFTYNGAYYADFKRDTLIHVTAVQNIQLGIKAGYSVVAGRLSFPIEMGIYLYSYEKDNGPVFQRIGLRYQINKNWTVCNTLKTHWAKADFSEFGVGYRFGEKTIKK